MQRDDTDLFVSDEPEIELAPELRELLDARIKSAERGRLVSSEYAHARIRKWLSNSSTKTKR